MPAELEAWRAGAGSVGTDELAEPSHSVPAEALEDLSPPVLSVDSIERLVLKKRASGDMERWKLSISKLPTTDTPTLILRVGTTTDALTLWALHSQLDKRGIAPCLRWPGNMETPQMQLISWLADLHWFAKRNRTHRAKFKSWQRLWLDEPGSAKWLERAYWIFKGMYGRQNLSSYTARGLGLAREQRQDLLTLPTSRMVMSRRETLPAGFANTRQLLLSHAMAHPDKSGTRSPDAIANRRARLWRVHVLSGQRPAETARHWALLTGETTARQVIARQLTAIQTVLLAPS